MNAQMGLPGMRQLASPNSAFKPVPQMLPPYSKNCFDIIQILYTCNCGAHGSVVMSVRPVSKRLLVQTMLWSLDVVCCALIDKILYLHCLSPSN